MPPVISFAPSSARKAVALPTSSMLTRLRVGACDCALSISSSNSGMPEAARVTSSPVELAPFLLDTFEHLLEFAFGVDVERHEDRGFERLGQRLDMLFGPLVQVGHGQFGAQCPERLGTTPRDRLVVGDTDDQALFAF